MLYLLFSALLQASYSANLPVSADAKMLSCNAPAGRLNEGFVTASE